MSFDTWWVDEFGLGIGSDEWNTARKAWDAAVTAERERCARIAEAAAEDPLGDPCRIIARRIRINPEMGE